MLQPHQQRVIDEKAELDAKINKLREFIVGYLFITLPAAERQRLKMQLEVMKKYSDILDMRIKAFQL